MKPALALLSFGAKTGDGAEDVEGVVNISAGGELVETVKAELIAAVRLLSMSGGDLRTSEIDNGNGAGGDAVSGGVDGLDETGGNG